MKLIIKGLFYLSYRNLLTSNFFSKFILMAFKINIQHFIVTKF